MPWCLRGIRLEQLAPVVLAATVFAFACGSSSVARIQQIAHPVRWVLLIMLLALAVAGAVRERGPLRLHASIVCSAIALGVLAFVSALWSVDQRLSFERSVTLGVLLVAAAALAQAAASRGASDRLLYGIVWGGAAAAVAGLLVLLFRHADAVEAATRDLPARYQGLGQNPNTIPLLLAPCLALVVWLLVRARTLRMRIGLGGLALLFDGSIIASGSRGSLVAGFIGIAIVVALSPLRLRTKVVLTAVTGAALAASIGIALAPKSKGEAWRPRPSSPSAAPGSHPKPGYTNVEGVFPLDSDIGTLIVHSTDVRRTLFGLTGRGEAWRGAIDLGNERPVLGYGFGNEGRVFVDRWANFVGGLPENSYIGMYLQLGLVGLLTLLGLAATLLVAAMRRNDRWDVAGPVGALIVGLVLACVQSYLYSVGNIATLAVWTAAFLGAARPRHERVNA